MLYYLRKLYLKIGIHTAPPGTLLYAIHCVARKMLPGARNPRKTSFAFDSVVAIRVTGGIGDHLIAARYVRDLLKASGGFTFDIYSPRPAIAEWVFADIPGLQICVNEQLAWNSNFYMYHLAMWVNHFAVIYKEAANWCLLYKKHKKLAKICETIDASSVKIEHHVLRHPFSDGFLAQEAVIKGLNRYTFTHALSGIHYGGDRIPIKISDDALEKFGLTEKTYITIHNGFDDAFLIEGKKLTGKLSTKVYPHFARVVELLREAFPDIFVVQLGTSTSTPIAGVSHNLINSTTLPETAAIIGGSFLHIDNESGLVHLAACLGVTSCVVFGPTSVEYFGYRDNINIHPDFCGNCWWLTKDWMANCPRGFDGPQCLIDTPAEKVFEAVQSYVTSSRNQMINNNLLQP